MTESRSSRDDGRGPGEIRMPAVTVDFCPAAYGSVLYESGNTRLICAASLDRSVPDHAARKGMGWLTAEYGLLPYSTGPRTDRPLLKRDGRAVEIQRLIGRTLRTAVDLTALAGYTITVDCDVLQADGGTRTAAITGGCIALSRAFARMVAEGLLPRSPLRGPVAAISVGTVDGVIMTDLTYVEDRRADVDLNVVMDRAGAFLEVQGTGERAPFTRADLDTMLELAARGITALAGVQDRYC